MPLTKEEVRAKLTEMGIEYEAMDHGPVYTIDEMKEVGSTRLSFGSEERLMANLGLTKGAVTPLGVLNDCAKNVEVLIDEDLRGRPRLGVHPCDNTETLWLSFDSIKKIIEKQGNSLSFIRI